MKEEKFNILILEDNPDDAELIVRELKKSGFNFEWKRVETEKAFKEAEEHNKLKQAEQTLKESEIKYRQLAETAKDVIMVLDLKGNVKYVNQEGIDLSGYSKEEALKMNINDVLREDAIPLSDNNLAKRLAGDKSLFMYEIDFFNKKGSKIPVEIKSSLITERGKPSGVLITARDITDRKKAEENLKSALEKATESDRLKSVFLNTISHELRTPLNAVIGFSEIIDKDIPIDEILDYSKTINDSGSHLLEIIEGIFDITMIESGEVIIQKEEFNITAFMDDIHKILKVEQELADKQHIDIYLNPAEKAKDFLVYTDQSNLKRVLACLFQKNWLNF